MRPTRATVLAADVGGTKVNLALFACGAGSVRCLRSASYPSHELGDLVSGVRRFLGSDPPRLHAAVFGVAGPVRQGRVQTTNLPWLIDEGQLSTALGIARVRLINDLEATAYGVLTLEPADILLLNPGATVRGNVAVIAAGTGLGEGGLFWDGVEYRAAPSEGGHADFAPRNALECALLSFLWKRYGHASYERLLSGAGLVTIYEFLREQGDAHEPPWLAARLREQDPAAVISQAALQGDSALCVQALHTFTAIYGAEAGNLGLKFMATGGVYVGGGIAPKIRTKLADGTFMAAFRDKGRMTALMDAMPVRVVLRETTALQGAAWCAARLTEKETTDDGKSP
ncbi:MAG: glucokinase [Candidatus Binatia bacterium]